MTYSTGDGGFIRLEKIGTNLILIETSPNGERKLYVENEELQPVFEAHEAQRKAKIKKPNGF